HRESRPSIDQLLGDRSSGIDAIATPVHERDDYLARERDVSLEVGVEDRLQIPGEQLPRLGVGPTGELAQFLDLLVELFVGVVEDCTLEIGPLDEQGGDQGGGEQADGPPEDAPAGGASAATWFSGGDDRLRLREDQVWIGSLRLRSG